MNITLLCRTEEKLSFTDGINSWFKQYAIGEFENEKERCNFVDKYNMREALNYLNPCIGMRRRVDVINNINCELDWEFLTCEKDIYAAALNIGDSDYYNAISLDHIHEQVKLYSEKMNSLQKELTELNDKIITHKHNAKSRLQIEYNDLFESQLKKNGVYTAYLGKYQSGAPKQKKIDIIRSTTRLQYDVTLARISTRIEIIQKELSEMKVQNF